jgi:hypothetical protein
MSTTPHVLALTDAQLDLIHRMAWPLAPADRGAYLEAVATALQAQPTIGDGAVYRIAVEMQRRFWSPPNRTSGAGSSRSRAY